MATCSILLYRIGSIELMLNTRWCYIEKLRKNIHEVLRSSKISSNHRPQRQNNYVNFFVLYLFICSIITWPESLWKVIFKTEYSRCGISYLPDFECNPITIFRDEFLLITSLSSLCGLERWKQIPHQVLPEIVAVLSGYEKKHLYSE